MSAVHLVERIRQVGGDIALIDGKVILRRRSCVPDDLAAEARAHAEDLRALLRENEPVQAEPIDLWDERLRTWVIACAERIIDECCDVCGRRDCQEHRQ